MEWLDEIEKRWAKAQKGPWMWDVNLATHSAHLTTTHSGRIYIMGFRRWGTHSAQPIFQDYEQGVMLPVKEFAIPRQAHHKDFDMNINHPDAEAIASAPADIARLIAVVKAQRQKINELCDHVCHECQGTPSDYKLDKCENTECWIKRMREEEQK